MTPTPRPPWLQPGPFCDLAPATSVQTAGPTHQHPVAGYTPEDWATACSVCASIDGLPRPGAEPATELRLRSWEAAWVAFDLLATPRSPRLLGGSAPAEDAALLVTDSFHRSWRICWQHNGTRYRVLTAVDDEGGQAVPVEALPRAWWPLLARPARLSNAVEIPGPDSVGPDAEGWREWVCPPWCQQPAGHADWRRTPAGVTRTHRAVFPLASGDRTVSLALTVDEHADAHGITWGERDIQIADTVVPTRSETAFVHALTRHLGAVLRVAALPLPSRARTVAGTQFIEIPGALCTAAGRSDYRRRAARAHRLAPATEVRA
ncbi:hypothetical protein [Nocardia wallacei]|uniref:hypothetical protein n=1 Tax=Nocardia wallacei TaxID=480035 RepID=UPI0024547275|nr:hypothetical protein [Nocardia wallacei]